MEEHLQRLRDYLGRSLTPLEVRDGLVSAYLVISRLNQVQGNPDVGLKQDEQGLLAHITGFMGAVFWERGFSYDQPTVEQMGEIKMMLDGMVQVYAMPENLQQALNEMCDVLLARGRGEPAAVSPGVMDLLQFPGAAEEAEPAAPAVRPAPAEPDLDRIPDEPIETVTAAAAPERLDVWSSMPEPEPAAVEPAAEPAPEPIPEPIPEAVPEPTATRETFMPGTWEVASDRPDEPRPDLVPSFESVGATQTKSAEDAAGDKPAKKRASRKKAASPAGAAGEAKPPRKRGKTAKAPVADTVDVEVPDSYLREEAAGSEPAAENENVDFGTWPTIPAPEPPSAKPAPEPWAEPAAAEPVATPEPARVNFSVPEPETPAESPQPAATKSKINIDLVPGPRPMPRSGTGAFFLGWLIGWLLIGGGGYVAYRHQVPKQLFGQSAELKKQNADLKTELAAVQAENLKLKIPPDTLATDWNKPPAKIEFTKTAVGGLVFYWGDNGLQRKYYVYRGKEGGELKRVKPDAQDNHFSVWSKPERGTWAVAVSALDKNGKETARSAPVKGTWPMK